MKKTIILASVAVAAIFAFSSCQKEELENTSVSGVRIITAEFENSATKTTLSTEDNLTPLWSENDKIRVFGTRASGNQYDDITLTSDKITNGGRTITFTTELTGTLYAVYPASATAMTSCSDGSITFTIPAIQDGTFASANICVAKSSTTDGTNRDNLVFRNATAVVKITTAADVVGVDITAAYSISGPVTASFDGTAVSLTTISLDKKYVSAVGTSAPTGNVFYLATAPVITGSATVNCYKTDKKGTDTKESKALQKNVIYSMDLSAMTIDNADLTGQHGILNGHEYVVVKCGATNLKWATMNIGATALTGADSYGYFLSWGDIAPKESYTNNEYKTTSANSINKNIDPDSGYDAARENWGSTWRMPTGNKGEFKALTDATYWQWDDTDKGYYVYAPQSGDAGKVNNGTGSYTKSDALLFFPAAGSNKDGSRTEVNEAGYYWSSTYATSTKAFVLAVTNSKGIQHIQNYRYIGKPVRAVSD